MCTEPSTWSALFFHLGSWSGNQIKEPCSYEQIPAVYSVFRLSSFACLSFLESCPQGVNGFWIFSPRPPLTFLCGWPWLQADYIVHTVSRWLREKVSAMSNGLLLGPLEFFRFKFISEIGAFPKPLYLLSFPSWNVILSDSIRCKVISPVCKKLMF